LSTPPTLPPPFFTGKHILIRPLSPALDAPLYHSWLQNPVFLPYKPYLKQLCSTPVQLFSYLSLQAEVSPQSEIEGLVIHKNTEIAIGMMGLGGIDRFNKKAEFSAAFVYGHGTHALWEAIHAGISLSFEYFDLHKLIFYVSPDNEAPLKLMQRYEFQYEGCLKEEILVDGQQRIDLHRYALMRSDWPHSRFHQRLNRIAPLSHT
jgi:RimJ/RimL family protein N-acetyltransferase